MLHIWLVCCMVSLLGKLFLLLDMMLPRSVHFVYCKANKLVLSNIAVEPRPLGRGYKALIFFAS